MAYTTINKSTEHFETTTYTGGATDVSSLSFQPDFVWVKKRTGAENHGLFDAVRGATKTINSNTTSAESTRSGSLTSFDNDGWSMGGSDGIISASGSNYVGWSWKANGAGSANTAGDLNSTVSVNTTAGFSIVSYTGNGTAGATVGHGLGVAPSMIIARRLNGVEDWGVYHQTLGASKYIILNTTGAEQSSTSRWGGVAPTNSVFTVGNHASVNASGGTHIAYCFAEKQGYSKFGSYTGNGNADGTFVYTGFKPAFVIIKSTDLVKNWLTFDNLRLGYNGTGTNKQLHPNTSGTETSGNGTTLDILSNGFKTRTTDSDENGSGNSYIFMAFAENPLVGTNNIPATAR